MGVVQEIISIVAPDGTLLYVSPSVFHVLGLRPEERIGEGVAAELHPDDRPAVEEAFRQVLDNPLERMELRYRVRHADGSWRVLDTIGTNHVADPAIGGVVLSSRDITERRAAMEQLRLQAGLLDAVGQAAIATDLEGRVTYWNPAAEKLYGRTREEVLGRDIQELNVMPEDRARAREIMEEVAESGSWTGDFTVCRKDGTTFPAHVSLVLTRDGMDAPAGFVGISSNIAPLVEAQEALHERVKELRLLSRATELLHQGEVPLEERLQELVTLMPSGWKHPGHTEVRLTLESRSLQTPGFRESPWMQSVRFRAQDEEGLLEVAVTAAEGDPEDEILLPEEQELLENLGRILGDVIERASLRRLTTQAFASIEEAVIVIDGSHEARGIRYVNPSAERMFGYSAEELIEGDTERLHVDRERFRRFGEESREALDRDGVFHGSFPLRRRDGTIFHAEQTVTMMDPDAGHRGGAVSVVRDVSVRREAEDRLRLSEERFRQIAERIEDAFWITSPEKDVIEYVSPAYEAIWGRSCEELYARPGSWLEAIVPADRDRVAQAVALQHGAPYEQEFRIERPDGEERWVLDRSFPIRNAEGKTERIVGVSKDITQSKRAIERFGLLSREITDILLVLSPEGVVEMVSPSVHQVTGYLQSEFEGMTALTFIHPEDRESVSEALMELAAHPGEVVRLEHRIMTKGGEARHLESVGRNLLSDPAIAGVLVTSRDVTERLALEQRVRQMQKMESIGQLAGGIAHDFNNLLTVIRSQTDLLLMDQPDGQSVEGLDIIQSAADRAAALTGQLLAFSREQMLQPRVVQLSSVIRRAGELLERVIGENVRIVYELPEGLPPVRVDPNQLEQIVLNLAVNARDAMTDGGTLTVSVYSETVEDHEVRNGNPEGPEPGDWLVLAVTDNGCGMTEEVRQRIFDPFFTTKAKGKGTGLGLSMVYGTVAQSGGHIQVESKPDQGSTFYLRFRPEDGKVAGESEDARAGGSEDSGQAGRDARREPLSGRILVIEDDPHVRRAVVKVLERAGLDVTSEPDAESGLKRLTEGESVDVVLTDLILPGMNGFELVKRVRAAHSELPLVVMSGYAEGFPGRREGLPDDVHFVQKPFTPERIVEVLREVLAGG